MLTIISFRNKVRLFCCRGEYFAPVFYAAHELCLGSLINGQSKTAGAALIDGGLTDAGDDVVTDGGEPDRE